MINTKKENKRNVPTLRFLEFEGEWDKKLLSHYMSFKNGINASKDQYGSGYKFINVLDIIENMEITYDDIIGSVNVSKETFKKNEVTYGDILFQRSSETREEVGQANVYIDKEKSATFGGFVIRGKCLDNYIPSFMNQLLKNSSVRKEITTRSGGSTRYNIGQATLEKTPIFTPDEKEQQKIATFLTAIDTKIQQLKQKHSLLQQYKKGVMQQIFNQQLRFKDDQGGDYPDWEEKRLGDIGKRITQKNTSDAESFVLTNSAVQGVVSQRSYFDKDIANKNNLAGYYVVDINDFVYNPRISSTAPVGPIKRNKLAKGVMSPLYTVLRLSVNNLEFFEYFFETTMWHRYMKGIANYGVRFDRMNITSKDFINMPVPAPCKQEQQKIATFLSSIDDKINQTQQQIQHAETFKKGLLQQMFV